MKNTVIKITKAGREFTLTLIGRVATITGDNLYKIGDVEYNQADYNVETLDCIFNSEKTQIKFIGGYFTYAGKRVVGFNLDEETIQIIVAAIEEYENEWNKEKADRENERIAPYIDESKYIVFSEGCDTGRTLTTYNVDAIDLAIEKGAKVYDGLRGERDASNKYEGHIDALIPQDFAKKIDGQYYADGYKFLYVEHKYISVDDYNDALNIIKKAQREEEQAKEILLSQIFEKAKLTGQPVVISKTSMPEQLSPLREDGEGDIVDEVTYAMPNGSTKIEYHHSY